MSNYYLDHIEDTDGNIVDITYWHRHCASSELRAKGDHPAPEWPGYTVACAGCHTVIHWAGVPALRFDGDSPLFDRGETVCANHLGFANDYRTDKWNIGDNPDACFICAEDRLIGAR